LSPCSLSSRLVSSIVTFSLQSQQSIPDVFFKAHFIFSFFFFAILQQHEDVAFRFKDERIDGVVQVCNAGIVSPEAIEVLVFQWFWFADGELSVAVSLSVARIDELIHIVQKKKIRTNCEVPFSQELFANGIRITNCQQVLDISTIDNPFLVSETCRQRDQLFGVVYHPSCSFRAVTKQLTHSSAAAKKNKKRKKIVILGRFDFFPDHEIGSLEKLEMGSDIQENFSIATEC
jgi:hypothetical protein